jgi:ferredoxin
MKRPRIPPRPFLSRVVARGLNPLNAFFDKLYHSEYNPLYRSGTLAIGLLFILLASGTVLLFTYSVGAPYQSIVEIQEQVWLGRWLRALHRYATDAALVAVVFHFLQLLAQGKTWGPRALAWISGVILLLALCISAWTGYVMVWDQHGQLVALSGLELIRVFPFLKDNLSPAFNGQTPMPASFFFMNMFLHVALPLGMFIGMWIHTSRLARTVWMPPKKIFWVAGGALTLFSILVPAVLPPEANLLQIPGRVPTDWWYGFWIPLIELSSPGIVLAGWAIVFFLGITIPWWWRPAKEKRPPTSEVIVEACSGCTQCVRDCPYEAIRMIPHPNGKHLLAEVSKNLCVSCGICAASCDDLAIGPAGRSAAEQIKFVDDYCAREFPTPDPQSIVVIACRHNESVPDFLEAHAADSESLHFYDVNCCGTLHSQAVEKLLGHAGALLAVGCTARNCVNRDGLDLLSGRLYEKRVPFISRKLDRKRIAFTAFSEAEKPMILKSLATLEAHVGIQHKKAPAMQSIASRLAWATKRTVATAALLGITWFFNRAPMGSDITTGVLRVVGKLPPQTSTSCRPLTAEEKASIPLHMQRKEICEAQSLSYALHVTVDGKAALQKTFTAHGARSDSPIIINEDLPLSPGEHALELNLISIVSSPDAKSSSELSSWSYKDQLLFKAGQIELRPIELSK